MNSKKTLEGRTVRILILSAFFFLSGLAFFLLRMTGDNDVAAATHQFSPDTSPSIEEGPRLIPSLAKYPPPSVFHQFTYERGDTLTVEGKCKDAYHVVMLFHEGVDYRATPLDARFNTAYPCTGTAYAEHIPIDTLFLHEGERYYVVKAHQGEAGVWYDPY